MGFAENICALLQMFMSVTQVCMSRLSLHLLFQLVSISGIEPLRHNGRRRISSEI